MRLMAMFMSVPHLRAPCNSNTVVATLFDRLDIASQLSSPVLAPPSPLEKECDSLIGSFPAETKFFSIGIK